MNDHTFNEASTIQDSNGNSYQEIPITIAEPEDSTTIIFTSYDENTTSTLMRSLSIFKKGVRAMITFTNRLWIAYTIMIAISVFIKRLSHNFGGDISPTLVYQITARNDKIPVYVTDGIPALFGTTLDQPIKTKIFHIDSSLSDFCSTYRGDYTKNNGSFVLVPRGGCLFERKVHFIQEAGFSGAIIYNALNSPKDKPIRMSSFYSNSNITITCMYLTYSSQVRLRPFVNQDVIISPHDWYFIPTGSSVKQVLYEFILFTIQLWKFSFSFLAFSFASLLIYNLSTKYSLELLETIQLCSDFLLDEGNAYSVPKLISIPFPKRILTLEDISSHNLNISRKSYNNSCCAICIDDFEVNDIVRDLPCGHVYHCKCVDEWLLEHNRLCPVCKQDVLKVCN